MSRLRFGTFEFDSATRELRRDGAPVRLQAQPAQVLAVLLAKPGEVVSRDALRQSLWGSDTHVDFESGLNFCIAQIRGTLGDSADAPLYIKTVPKRGYQFIAPVSEVGSEPASRPLPYRRAVVPLLGAGLLGLGGWIAWARWRAASRPAVRIAVARFENQSGDPNLDRFADGLTDAVVVELTASGPDKFAVIGNAPILREARDRQDLARIASELKADYVVIGQVQRASGKGRILVHLIRLPDQKHITVNRVDDPDFADPLRTQADVARGSVRVFATRLPR